MSRPANLITISDRHGDGFVGITGQILMAVRTAGHSGGEVDGFWVVGRSEHSSAHDSVTARD